MAEVGSARVRITADDSQARSTLSGFTGFLKKTAGIASGVMAGLALFEGMKESVKAIGEATIGANASMEQYEQTLTVVLKSHEKAKDTLKWASKFAQETPFEIPDIVEATTRLSSYGMNAQKVLQDTGDMAAVMGKPLMQAVEAVADAQTGELERLKEFGITKKMIIDQSKKMGMDEIVNSKGQITDLDNFNKALFALMRSRYKGGMELQSQTFNGMISNAKDSMGTLMRELSKPVFDKLKDGMKTVLPVMTSFTSFVKGDVKVASKTLEDAFGADKAHTIMGYFESIKKGVIEAKNWIMQFEPAVRNLIDIAIGLGPSFKAVGGAIAVAFIQVAKVLPPVINELTRVAKVIVQWEGFTPVVLGLASAFVTLKVATAVTTAISALRGVIVIMMNPIGRALVLTQLWSKAMVFLNATLLANPIGLVIAALVGLGVAFYEAYKHSKVFRDFVDGIWSKAKTDWVEFAGIMASTGQKIAAQAKKDYNELATGLSLIGNRIKTQAQSDYNDLVTIATTVGGRIKTQAQQDYNDISTALATIGSRVKTQAQSDYNDILTVARTVGGRIKTQALQDYNDFVKGTNWVMNELPKKMNDWGVAIDRFFATLPARTQAKLALWGTAIKNWAIAQNEENKRQFGAWWTAIQNWITSKPAQWRASLNTWWSAISAWWDSLPSRTSAKVSTWWNGIQSNVSNKYNSWKAALGRWWQAQSEWWSSLPSRTASKMTTWWNSIQTNVRNKYNSWKAALGRWWDAQSEWWSSLPSRTAQKISTWWSGIDKSVRNKYNNWKSALGRWWDAQSEWWSGLPSKTNTKLNNWWKNISSWVVKTAKNWRTSLESWWKEIKNWFEHLDDKPEVRNAGSNIVKKVADGSEKEKKTFFDKLGRIVVDGLKYALIFAAITILATGREIIKRMIKGVTQTLPEWYNKFMEMRKNTIKKLVDMGTGLYQEAKKIPGKIGKGIKEKMNDAGGAMKSLADNLVTRFKKALGINSPSKVFYDLTGYIFDGIKKRLTGENLKSVGMGIFDDFAKGAGAAFTNVKGFITGAGGNLKSWLMSAMAVTNTPMSWLPYLQTIAMKESGGRTGPSTINKWDSNWRRGTPSMGLMQTIMPTFQAFKVPGLNDIMNPVHNAAAAIRYIKKRYGNILNVPGIKSMLHGGPYKGYAKGGFFLNGPEMAMFGEGGPEMALPLIGKNMMPYAQAVAMNLSNMLGGLTGGGVDLSSLGPFILRVDLNGKTIAEQIYQDINEMQDRQDYRNRRSRGEV